MQPRFHGSFLGKIHDPNPSHLNNIRWTMIISFWDGTCHDGCELSAWSQEASHPENFGILDSQASSIEALKHSW